MLIHQNVTGKDKCGQIIQLPDKNGEAVTAYTAGALAKGTPVLLTYAYTEGREVTAVAPATMAYVVMVGVAYEAIGATSIGLIQISGLAECLVDDTSSLSAGEFVRAVDAGTYLVDDGTTARSNSAWGVLKDAVTAAEGGGSAVLKTVLLFPEQKLIDAS